MKLARLLCFFDHHRPVRHRVEGTSRNLTGICRYCGKPITRISHRKWRRTGKTLA